MDITKLQMRFDGLVGEDVRYVVAALNALLSDFEIVPIPVGSVVTRDLRPKRIRVYYDPDTLEVVYDPVNG